MSSFLNLKNLYLGVKSNLTKVGSKNTMATFLKVRKNLKNKLQLGLIFLKSILFK